MKTKAHVHSKSKQPSTFRVHNASRKYQKTQNKQDDDDWAFLEAEAAANQAEQPKEEEPKAEAKAEEPKKEESSAADAAAAFLAASGAAPADGEGGGAGSQLCPGLGVAGVLRSGQGRGVAAEHLLDQGRDENAPRGGR